MPQSGFLRLGPGILAWSPALVACLTVSSLAAPGLAVGVNPPRHERAGKSRLNGEQVLVRARAAYAKLRSYDGTSAAIAKLYTKAGAKTTTARARIRFERPAKIRIEGTDAERATFRIVSNGRETLQSVSGHEGGRWRRTPSLQDAIGFVTGSARNTPTMIPALLLPLPKGSPFARLGKCTLEGHGKVKGADCYKVIINAPHSTCVYWVDTRSYLLRQFREQQNARQFAQYTMQTRGISLQKLGIKGQASLHTFSVSSFNKPMNPMLWSVTR
jgi:hypothetical protein